MKTELILATFDQRFNLQLDAYIKNTGSVENCGLVSLCNGDFDSVYDEKFLMLGSRQTLDNDPDYTHIRQLIPYVLVQDHATGNIAVYSRTKRSTEARLHDKLSIGFGGHIDLDDIVSRTDSFSHIDVRQTIINSCYRELAEELGIHVDNVVEVPDDGIHAHIISREDAVGTVHLGLVYRVVVRDVSRLSIESELNFVGWYAPQQLSVYEQTPELQGLEGWSKLVLDFLEFDQIPALPYPGA